MRNELSITIRRLERLLTACALVLCLASSLLIVELVHSSAPKIPIHRWAGYQLYGFETPSGQGVKARIYTIDPYVPNVIGSEMLCEWVNIALQYSPISYWLQVGYYKGYHSSYALAYYYEYRDSRGYSGICVGRWGSTRPQFGSWHTYSLMHPYGYGQSSDPQEWRVYVDGSPPGSDLIRVYPYDAVDQQVVAETVSQLPAINITGSHFKGISWYTLVRYWYWALWDTHVGVVRNEMEDPIYNYNLTEVSDSEFIASGGG